MGEEWWAQEVETDAQPGLPVVKKPKIVDEVDSYRIPTNVTAAWIRSQLTKQEWDDIKSTQNRLLLNPELIASMCKDAKKGLSKRSIMARHGYSVQTWGAWERKAADGMQPYALWYTCMMISISSVEEELMDNIRDAGREDWKASKWLLEQLNKDEYGPTPKGATVNINGDVNNETSVNHVSPSEAMNIAKIMQAIGALPEPEVLEGEVIEDDTHNSDPEGS